MAWQDRLLPASFRGVPFLWDETRREGGRRLAIFEFPYRDGGYVEDLGRRVRKFPVRAYVLGDDYMDQRDQLLAALDSGDGPGTLVHPYLGPLTVAVETYAEAESQDEGRMARFDMNFIEAGAPPSPVPVTDTQGAVADASTNLQGALELDFSTNFSLSGVTALVSQAAGALQTALAIAANPMLAIAGIASSVLGPDLGAVSGISIADVAGFATAVTTLYSDFAAAVVALFPSALVSIGTTEDSSRLGTGQVSAADPTYGLASLAAFGDTLPAIAPSTSSRAVQAANQAIFLRLAQGQALAALAIVYAGTSFASSADAETARDTITGLLDGAILAADAGGADAVTQALEALYAAVAIDLTQRGKSLPNILSLTFAAPLPAVVIAERLYADATRGPELVSRNAAPHPLFLPLTVEALSS